MDTAAWAAYFEDNQDRAPAFVPIAVGPSASGPNAAGRPVDPELMAAIARSLQRFHLGEAGEGRVAHEAEVSDDPALDEAARRAIGLYVREEGRHAREVAGLLAAIGSHTARRHWSESLFRRGRRSLGLRTKMMTIASAEVVGIVFYGMLRDHGPTDPIRRLGEVICEDEVQHLAFQAEWFAHAVRTARGPRRAVVAAGVGAEFVVIVGSAIGVFTLDHGPLIRAMGLRRRDVAAKCARVAASALRRAVTGSGLNRQQPGPGGERRGEDERPDERGKIHAA